MDLVVHVLVVDLFVLRFDVSKEIAALEIAARARLDRTLPRLVLLG